ncbi:MAG: hypothetical protein ACI8TP_005255 [Acidimicrobiales bacterium]|jgi:uncharacterized protein
MGTFEVVVRRHDGSPVVLENGPLFESGRPMPTRYWLADRALNRWIGRLESEKGVKRAEADVDPVALAATHAAYEHARTELLPEGHTGPAPSGGVGGTRTGVKCLHAHYANHLAGAHDVVGEWVEARLVEVGAAFDPSEPGIASKWDEMTDVENSDVAQ